MDERTERIAALNDQLRMTGRSGKILGTPGFRSSPYQREIIDRIRTYEWKPGDGNDPYSERDFGVVEMDGDRYYFKIDYFAPGLERGSEDPSDAEQTVRVMTIMHSSEW